MAIYIGDSVEDLGAIVRVVSRFPCPEPVWFIHPPLPWRPFVGRGDAVYDSSLQPIRPGGADEETVLEIIRTLSEGITA